MIVCFDTNVLVSAVATRGLCADIVNAALAEHQLVIGKTILAELRQVLCQKLRLPAKAAEEMDAFLRLHATVIDAVPATDFPMLDDSDSAVLTEAMAGKAAVLVTGDQALPDCSPGASIRIMSPRAFWELLRSG